MEPQQIEQTIREYIDQIVHMSLATSANNQPWVCEVHFAVDDELNIYFRSIKSAAITAHRLICTSIVSLHFVVFKVCTFCSLLSIFHHCIV